MFKKTSTLALVVFLAMGIVSIGFAQGMNRPQRGQGGPGQGFMGAGPMKNLDRMAKHLELTDEQQTALKDLHEGQRKDTTDLRNQAELISVELRQLWRADELDADKIRAKTAQLSELKSELQAIGTNYRLERAQVLTTEQRAKLNRGRESMRGRRNGGNKSPRMNRGHRGEGRSMNRRGPGNDGQRNRFQQQGQRPGPAFDGPGPRGRGWHNAPPPEQDAPQDTPAEQPSW